METKRNKILNLAKEYLNDENYQEGFITTDWIKRIREELKLNECNDLELAEMWDIVFLTINNEYLIERLNGNVKEAIKWEDVKSAFIEVVNQVARERKGV